MSYFEFALLYRNLCAMLDGERKGYALTTAVARGVMLGLLLLAVYVRAASASVTASSQGTCRTTAIVNYAKPLREMASMRRVPPSGRLSFAPRSIRMNVVGGGAISGTHAVGFDLELWQSSAGPPIDVNWRIDTELAFVNRRGSVTKILASRRQRVGKLSDNNAGPPLTFRVRRPAFYRVEVTFSDRHRRQLGRYVEYFRALKRWIDVHLEFPQRVLHAGDILESRLENSGTTFLSFGEEFAIDRFVGGRWQRDPLTPDGFIQVELVMFGGQAYVCRNMKLPSDMASGHYRFSKRVQIDGGARRELMADFHVSP
jgi:hypothetical protein